VGVKDTLANVSCSWVSKWNVDRVGVFIDVETCAWSTLLLVFVHAQVLHWLCWGREACRVIPIGAGKVPQWMMPAMALVRLSAAHYCENAVRTAYAAASSYPGWMTGGPPQPPGHTHAGPTAPSVKVANAPVLADRFDGDTPAFTSENAEMVVPSCPAPRSGEFLAAWLRTLLPRVPPHMCKQHLDCTKLWEFTAGCAVKCWNKFGKGSKDDFVKHTHDAAHTTFYDALEFPWTLRYVKKGLWVVIDVLPEPADRKAWPRNADKEYTADYCRRYPPGLTLADILPLEAKVEDATAEDKAAAALEDEDGEGPTSDEVAVLGSDLDNFHPDTSSIAPTPAAVTVVGQASTHAPSELVPASTTSSTPASGLTSTHLAMPDHVATLASSLSFGGGSAIMSSTATSSAVVGQDGAEYSPAPRASSPGGYLASAPPSCVLISSTALAAASSVPCFSMPRERLGFGRSQALRASVPAPVDTTPLPTTSAFSWMVTCSVGGANWTRLLAPGDLLDNHLCFTFPDNHGSTRNGLLGNSASAGNSRRGLNVISDAWRILGQLAVPDMPRGRSEEANHMNMDVHDADSLVLFMRDYDRLGKSVLVEKDRKTKDAQQAEHG
jgi:hypothetical protein